MKFVDRNKEISKLTTFLDASDSVLAVIYGRRRVGKSTLIKRAIEGRNALYFQADETQTSNQLSLLSKSVSIFLPGFDKVIYPDWYALLEALNYRLGKGSVVCLDEFPYLVKSYPALPSVLQNFLDNSNPAFKLVLCGSSQQSMYADILNEASPLYGRADLIMKVKPLSMGYITEAMDLPSVLDAVKYYSVWGGVPRYWKLCMNCHGFEQSFKTLLLEHEATLVDEPNRLLRDDMRDLTLSRTLLSVIGDGANRLSEIAAKMGKPSQELTGPIKKLIDMGYVEKDIPFGENPKKTKKTLYKIKDQFLNAYYRFVAPNASLISLDRPEAVWHIVEPGLPHFIGASWETLCREAVSGNIIDGIAFGSASRWWGAVSDKGKKQNQEVEIDVVAESIDRKHLLIGECKWTSRENGQRVLAELKQKASKLPFYDAYPHIHYVLFLKEEPSSEPECLSLFPKDIVDLLR